MKVTMIYPDPISEKGISKYSISLIENIRKNLPPSDKINGLTFIQGKPISFFHNLKNIKESDIIQIQHEYNLLGWFSMPFFLVYPFLKIFSNAKIVTTMHTVLSEKEPFQSGVVKTFLRKILYKIQNRWISSFSDKIVVHSNHFKEILYKDYKVPKEKITVFPHPILEDIKITPQNKAKKALGLKGPVYLLIGTMVPDHGHDIVLRTADKIGKTILVASNPTAINYKNESKITNFLKLSTDIVKKNNFEKYVRFDFGQISYEKWWKYFSAADLILLPYRGGIGSGIFADAMAVRKPVIASNIPYFREFAKEYGSLLIAKTESDFPNSIKNAMKPNNYKKMIEESQRYFDDNNLTKVSKNYIKFYKSI